MGIRVIIVDDHPLVRAGLSKYFEKSTDIEVVFEAGSGEELLKNLEYQDADVVLLDMSMPGLCGVDLIRSVKSANPALRILVLTMHDDIHVALRAIKAGASGFLCKGCGRTELIDAIRKVSIAGNYLAPQMAEQIAFINAMPAPARSEPEMLLSSRELQIYRLIVGGMNVKAIAYELGISEKTVSTHKGHLLRKLGLKNVQDLVRYDMQSKLFP